MFRNISLWSCLLLAFLGTAIAKDNGPAAKNAVKAVQPEQEEKSADAKELSGMSIVGNDEAPKALYIVPWKGSEIGRETSVSMMLNESAAPVDRDVFRRQLEFYEQSTKK
jgi:hypothetical protein